MKIQRVFCLVLAFIFIFTLSPAIPFVIAETIDDKIAEIDKTINGTCECEDEDCCLENLDTGEDQPSPPDDMDAGCECADDEDCECLDNTDCNCADDSDCECIDDIDCGCADDSDCECLDVIGCDCVDDMDCDCFVFADFMMTQFILNTYTIDQMGEHDHDKAGRVYFGNDLGANWSALETTFKVWAPEATSVSVNLSLAVRLAYDRVAYMV